MGHLGTVSGYSQRVPTKRYSPPSADVAARIDHVVELFQRQQEIEAEYKKALAELTKKEGDAVPIAHIADRLGVERKTVYRHLGRSMT
jgi:transcriptional regulator of acetoin/glycerol metabolism